MKRAVCRAQVVALTSAILLSSALATEAPPDPRKFAIAGVRLEMTVDEVQAALKSYDPAFTIEMKTEKAAEGDGTDLYLQAIKPDATYPAGYSEDLAVAFTRSTPHRAFALIHVVGFTPGKELAFDTVEKEITDKYGPGVKAVAGFHDWVFDAADKVIDGTPTSSNETSHAFTRCWHGLFEPTIMLSHGALGQVGPNGLPTAFRESCGISVRVILQTYDRAHPELVQEVYERLMSDKLAVSDGRPTEDPEAVPPKRQLNPHGPDL
jgi:hypothetical protein